MHSLKTVLAALLLVAPVHAIAADASSETKAEETKPKADLGNYDRRVELAKRMHKIRPTREQVDAAIDQASQSQPLNEQEPFRTAMRNILNYQAIEKISVDAMADTFSEKELEAMVEYYETPEARSASDKETEYASKVYPEIIRMLDQAMMRLRTGKGQ